jgi:hypothetical protein
MPSLDMRRAIGCGSRGKRHQRIGRGDRLLRRLDLYRVVYTVTVDGRKRSAMEEWRLSHRGEGAKR